ncbi:DUF2071 domain-containing protein [Endomicrobium sp. AH-315-J14]|nr:DUF2071 domain-containing protein [Endomicrobium sp. AH-315-J14]
MVWNGIPVKLVNSYSLQRSRRADDSPVQGLGDVSSNLEDVVIASWDVDLGMLGSHLPQGIEPERFSLDDGSVRGMISAVSFKNTDFYVGFAPFVKLRALQTNYRAYVRRGGQRAVWFFGTSLGSPVIVPRHVWGLPWARSKGQQEATWEDGTLSRLHWEVHSSLGSERLALRGSGTAMGRLDGFESEARTQQILTHPTVGYIRRRRRDVVTYSVWHPPFSLERAEVDLARFSYFEDLDLVSEGTPPHSVLVQQRIHYLIFLPPKRLGPQSPF